MPAVTAATPTPYKGRGFDRWAPLPSWSLSSQGERMPPPPPDSLLFLLGVQSFRRVGVRAGEGPVAFGWEAWSSLLPGYFLLTRWP